MKLKSQCVSVFSYLRNLGDSRLPVLAAFVAAVLLVSWGFTSGFETVEASGTCFTEEVRCHGMPFGSQCVGVEDREYEYVSKDSCGNIDEIRLRCDRLRNISCQNGDQWINKSVAFGRSCYEWNQTYNLGMQDCKQ